MKKEHLYVVVHNHRFGESTYVVRCGRNKRRRRARRTTALARPITLPLRSRGEPLERVL